MTHTENRGYVFRMGGAALTHTENRGYVFRMGGAALTHTENRGYVFRMGGSSRTSLKTEPSRPHYEPLPSGRTNASYSVRLLSTYTIGKCQCAAAGRVSLLFDASAGASVHVFGAIRCHAHAHGLSSVFHRVDSYLETLRRRPGTSRRYDCVVSQAMYDGGYYLSSSETCLQRLPRRSAVRGRSPTFHHLCPTGW